MTPAWKRESVTIYQGDALGVLRSLPDESVDCCVTSPPYWGLRNYGSPPEVWGGTPGCEHVWAEDLPRPGNAYRNGHGNMFGGRDDKLAIGEAMDAGTGGAFCSLCGAWRGCLGMEPTPELYTDHMTAIFGEVRRVLKGTGTLWLNLGDSYFSSASQNGVDKKHAGRQRKEPRPNRGRGISGKPKDVVGVPWRVAFALQADGWWLRQDIIWAKPNPMPNGAKDRCTTAHEYLFLLSKRARYYWDYPAMQEPGVCPAGTRGAKVSVKRRAMAGVNARPPEYKVYNGMRNKRSVWTVRTSQGGDTHPASFPPALIEPCILAGCPAGGTVLDPFLGSGTTLMVAAQHHRGGVGIELNPEYVQIAIGRITPALGGPLFTEGRL